MNPTSAGTTTDRAALPKGWERSSISSVLLPTETRNPTKCGAGEFLYVDIEAIDNTIQRVVQPKVRDNANAPSRARRSIRRGDVLVSLVRPYLRNIAVVPPELDDQIASTAFCVCRPSTGIEPRYLFHYLCQPRFIQTIPTYGDSPPAAHDDEFLAMSIPIPPTAEQARIVSRIDELFSDLDSGVEALRRVRRKLGRYRAAVLHAAVTGRLSARWREEHAGEVEPAADLLARILKARREHWEAATLRKYEAKGKTPPKGWRVRYKEPELATSCEFSLPTGWAWATVAQCSSLIQYGTSAKCGPDSEGVPVLRMGNITNRGTLDTSRLVYLPQEHPAFPSLLLEPGDVLFNRTNSAELVGKSALFADSDRPASFASYLIRVQCLQGFASQWAVHCLVSPIGRRWARRVLHHTAGQANINGTKLGAFEVPLPPEAEQSVILEEVDRQLSLIDTLDAEVDRALLRSGRLRQSILKAAFEGKLVPQNPADEPASALLARLRAQAESDKAAGKGRRKKAASKKGDRKKTASKKPPRKKSGPRRKAADPESLFRSSD